MSLRDLEAFLRQAVATWNPSVDTTPGSPFDNRVVQPLVRRIGPDPFTVDLETFLVERLQQAYPKLASNKGDSITDLLVKPAVLLWDPIVRETRRVQRNLSFADPTTLTTDEADSLGGNFFVPRRRGNRSRGVCRILFATPQKITASQNNFVTSRGGLIFLPTAVQSIRAAEMLLNVSPDGLYYFDVSTIAEKPGAAYDIEPNELSAIANMDAAVRVTNIARFRGGLEEETPFTYANRLQQSLGEKSLVTLRGIAAKLLEGFPGINRLNVVGYNDPEMQRDVIRGGGLGSIISSGLLGQAISDGNASPYTRRFYTNEVNFDTLIGTANGFVLTVFNAVPGPQAAADIKVVRVVDQNSIEVERSILVLSASNLRWTLRKEELTLSHIPGGILFPNTPNGELVVPDNTVHVGGAYDSFIRERGFDEVTLPIRNVVDDVPSLAGTKLLVVDISGISGTALVQLDDYTYGPEHQAGDAIDLVLQKAEHLGYDLQIQNGPSAGTYRILEYFPAVAAGDHPVLRIEGTLPVVSAITVRWRIFDDINIDLLEPKETRVSGVDLVLTQGLDTVTTSGGISFAEFGVVKGDTLRIAGGINEGDYTIVEDPLVPAYDTLRLDRILAFSAVDTNYRIFKPEEAVVSLPLIRIRTVELLDSSSQPLGSFIPYAKPVDVQSRAFQNPSRGVKHDFRNARLGIVSLPASALTKSYTIGVGLNTLTFYFPTLVSPSVALTLPTGVITVADLIAAINAALLVATGGVFAEVLVPINDRQFGVRPVGNGFVAIIGGTARSALFGYTDLRTTADVRTDEGDLLSNWWSGLDPRIDAVTGLDVLQVVDGRNVGFYGGPFLLAAQDVGVFPQAAASRALTVGRTLSELVSGQGRFFSPDAQRHVLIGARSLGSVRVYFLEPTTFEVDIDTIFWLDTGPTGIARFIPDPTLTHQQIPALPNGSTPNDGTSSHGTSLFSSSSQDFLLSNVNIGDRLFIENHPVTGSVIVTDPVLDVAGKTLVYSIDNGPDRTVLFVRDDPSIPATAVTRVGLLEQVNASIGLPVASYDVSGRITFGTDKAFIIRSYGTANTSILGNVLGYTGPKAFSGSDTSNESPHRRDGGYAVTDVSPTLLGISPPVASADLNWPSTITDQTFRVERVGVQRISTTQMALQPGGAGLYYADIELVSEGTGNFWNIDAGLQLKVQGYRADGYYLTTDDENLTFSLAERPKLVLSRSIIERGMDDDPRNATKLAGRSMQVTYDRSELVSDVQAFLLSETERVVCASPLSRHLVPHFVRFDLEYFGGSTEDVVQAEIEKYVNGIYPVDGLDSSDVQKIVTDRGATKVTNPLVLIALVHHQDRSIYVQRSYDSLRTGRLNAFFSDRIVVKRNVSGVL